MRLPSKASDGASQISMTSARSEKTAPTQNAIVGPYVSHNSPAMTLANKQTARQVERARCRSLRLRRSRRAKMAARMHCVQPCAAQGFHANEDPHTLVGLITCQLGKQPPPRALLGACEKEVGARIVNSQTDMRASNAATIAIGM
jgi:hypothetical protein